jgi:hypothetical protein
MERDHEESSCESNKRRVNAVSDEDVVVIRNVSPEVQDWETKNDSGDNISGRVRGQVLTTEEHRYREEQAKEDAEKAPLRKNTVPNGVQEIPRHGNCVERVSRWQTIVLVQKTILSAIRQ